MAKTTDLIAALRCSSSVPSAQLDCRTCAFHMEETVYGKDYAGCECDRILVDAADKIEELVDRCARYAEEIAVLQEKVNTCGECGGIDRLRELEEADKNGRVVVLPCKIGDVLYRASPSGVVVHCVANVVYRELTSRWYIDTIPNLPYASEELGKTTFLTREEAEKALETMK